MKKTQVFMGVGSLVLASAAFLAAKPAKNSFSTVQANMPAIGPNGNTAGLNLTSTHFTFVDAGSLSSVYLKTANNSIIQQVLTGTGGTRPLFFKP